MVTESSAVQPYKWGKFQGIVSFVFGCLLLAVGVFLASQEEAVRTMPLWMSRILLALTGMDLIRRRRSGVVLVYVLFVLTLLVPLTGQRSQYAKGYLFYALGLLFWGVPAISYYPKRWKELR